MSLYVNRASVNEQTALFHLYSIKAAMYISYKVRCSDLFKPQNLKKHDKQTAVNETIYADKYLRGELMTMTLDDFIVWLLRQTEDPEELTEELEQRMFRRLFPDKEAEDNGEE